MRCENCGNYIPKSIEKCPQCLTKYELDTKKYPTHDKYGYPTNRVNTDSQKENVREIYMESLLKQKMVQTQPSNLKSVNSTWDKAFDPRIIVGGPLMFGMFGVVILGQYIGGVPAFFVGIIAFLGIFFGITIAIDNVSRKKQNRIIEEAVSARIDTDKEYKAKEAYYSSHMVIGFSVLHHKDFVGDYLCEFYEHYEIDKNNIREITYDTKNAGYILHLNQPAFWDYGGYPTDKIFIADIFDDDVLTEMLQMNLPAKNINF